MLSIVIPTKNEETYLPTLLASVQRQSLQPDEIIVADAQSTDGTRRVAESYGCTVVEGGMPGPGRNAGAAVARGDTILFLDADVELKDTDFLKKAIEEFGKRHLGLATCDLQTTSDAVIDKVLHAAYNSYVRLFASVHPHAPGFCMLVRRDLHQTIHGFDASVVYAEDHDYALRATKHEKFGILTSVTIPVSNRRAERDGRVMLAIKTIFAEPYIWMFGPIRSDVFRYRFGHEVSKSTL